MNNRITLSLLAMLLVAPLSNLNARVINVPDDFETIQAGIDAAEDGDTVLVAPGEYLENINFNGKAIVVIGVPDDRRDHIIDGGGEGSVVTFENDEDENSQLSGFELRNGAAHMGGGILIDHASPTLSNLEIRSNSASLNGGGIACIDRAAPIITDVNIIGNSTELNGGGLYVASLASPILVDLFFSGNRAGELGGQVYCWNAEVTISYTLVLGDGEDAYIMGEGIYMTSSTARLDHVLIEGCHAEVGGGLAAQNNCTIDMNWVYVLYNEASTQGGGIYVDDSQVIINHLTCVENSAGEGLGGGIYIDGSEIDLVNSIFWSNEAETGSHLFLNGGSFDITYCDFEDGTDGVEHEFGELVWDHIITEYPEFFSVNEGDFSLRDDSPCIDTGDPESPLDPDGTRAEMGAFCYHQRDIDVDPDTLEFVGVQPGTVDSLAVVVRNVGLTTLNLTSVDIASFDAPLDVDELQESLPIEPFSNYDIWVRFLPFEENQYLANLIIASDDPDEATVEVLISASALSVRDDLQFPTSFGITGIYPNPFNSETVIRYSIPQSGVVCLRIYDVNGRIIQELFSGRQQAGWHQVSWSGLDSRGLVVSSGIYFSEVRYESPSSKPSTRLSKMLLIR